MFFALSKILHVFIEPFTWILLVLLSAFFLKKYRKKLLVSALVLFVVFTNKLIISIPETLFEPKAIQLESTDTFDYGIVLGGYSAWDKGREMVNFHGSIDRLIYGLKLQDKGHINRLILSGGTGSITDPDAKEAAIIKEFLGSMLEGRELILEPDSRNTYESALKCSHLLGNQPQKHKVLLISSAVHLPRAKRAFRKQGIEVTVYPVDFTQSGPVSWYDYFLPSIETLSKWNRFTHEWFGLLMYKLRGFI